MKKMMISFLSVMSIAVAGCSGMRDNLAGSMENVGTVEMLQADEERVVQTVAEEDQRSVEKAETGIMVNADYGFSAGMPEDIVGADSDIQIRNSMDTELQETTLKEASSPEVLAETLEVAKVEYVHDSIQETDNAQETELLAETGGTMATEPKEQAEAAPEVTEDEY